jgi:hypothetical protein
LTAAWQLMEQPALFPVLNNSEHDFMNHQEQERNTKMQ